MTGKKVVVVGGGAVGLDVVEFFAPRGAETTIIEMMPVIGNGLDASSTSSMKECMEKTSCKTDDEYSPAESKCTFLPRKIRWKRRTTSV